MTDSPTKAKLLPKTDASGARRDGTKLDVDFNPESLSLTIRNTMEEAKRDRTAGRPSQLVASSEVTLAVQLLFDSTLTGSDVRISTAQIAEMMRPGAIVAREDGKRRPLVIAFIWNEFTFEGIISDYSETLDYFSAEGIPLRSTVDLTLTKHEAAFPAPGGAQAADAAGAGTAPPTAPVGNNESLDDSVARAAPWGAAATSANDVAAANGVDNRKNPGVSEIASPTAAFDAGASAGAFGSPLSGGGGAFASAGAGISFGAEPAAFASGDASFGLDLGASAGAGISAGGGLSAGASLGGGGDLAAGVSLGDGSGGLELDAFAGLNPPKAMPPLGGSLGGDMSFELPELGGALSMEGGASLGGTIGLSASAGAGIGVGGGQVASVGKEINLADILFKEDI